MCGQLLRYHKNHSVGVSACGVRCFRTFLYCSNHLRTIGTQFVQQESLHAALRASDHSYSVAKGDGAFYGPKIDFTVTDAIMRPHQLGTIQLDFNLPIRYKSKNFVQF